jgi:site-specific DNA-adenine methylase
VWIGNDLNPDVVNVWRTVRDDPKTLGKFRVVDKMLKSMNAVEKLEMCRRKTQSIPGLRMDRVRASWYVLMIYCALLGHVVRKNRFYFDSLDKSVLYNKVLTCATERYAENLENVSEFMTSSKHVLYNLDYKRVLAKAKKGDFVFLDPPYQEAHNYKFDYNAEGLKNADLVKELSDQVRKLDKKGVKWMMTQADTRDVRRAFSQYDIVEFKVYRLASKSFKTELIIRNYSQ